MIKGHTHKAERITTVPGNEAETETEICVCGATRKIIWPGAPCAWINREPDIGHLWITRRTDEQVYIGDHVIELEHASHAGCKFRMLNPSHAFFLPPGASIRLFESVDFCLVDAKPTWAKIRISAPKNIKILRGELHEQG